MAWSNPSVGELRKLLRDAREDLLVVSPFISTYGVSVLKSEIRKAVRIEVWTRLSVPDWLLGYSDPVALHGYLAPRMDAGTGQLLVGSRLHAKAFVADRERGFAGSANLTGGGLGRNVEIWADDNIPTLLEALHERSDLLQRLSRENFDAWVGALPTLDSFKARVNDELAEAIDSLPTLERAESLEELDDFIEWCAEQEDVNEIAKRAVDFATNRTGENVSGHIKHAFYAVQLFFALTPEHERTLREMSRDQPFQLQEHEMLDDWLAFVDLYRDYEDEAASYATRTLLTYLTPTFGGHRTGGGGGDNKLKIAMPLVANYLSESRSGRG